MLEPPSGVKFTYKLRYLQLQYNSGTGPIPHGSAGKKGFYCAFPFLYQVDETSPTKEVEDFAY